MHGAVLVFLFAYVRAAGTYEVTASRADVLEDAVRIIIRTPRFNLDALTTLAQVASTPDEDLWRFGLPDGRDDWSATWASGEHDPQVGEVLRTLPVRNPLLWVV